jgi:hypothetical protein
MPGTASHGGGGLPTTVVPGVPRATGLPPLPSVPGSTKTAPATGLTVVPPRVDVDVCVPPLPPIGSC